MKRPLIIGLTGGIGMGKSTAAALLSGFGLPVYSADTAVHALLKKGGKAVKPVAKLFPHSLKNGAIDHSEVSRAVFGKPALLKKLENILHPLVREAERKFLAKTKKNPAVILEIPLLFETRADKRCDLVLCVSAPKAVQKQRVMKRPGMTPQKYKAIVARQLPEIEKRRRADYIIRTGKSYADTKNQLESVLKKILPWHLTPRT